MASMAEVKALISQILDEFSIPKHVALLAIKHLNDSLMATGIPLVFDPGQVFRGLSIHLLKDSPRGVETWTNASNDVSLTHDRVLALSVVVLVYNHICGFTAFDFITHACCAASNHVHARLCVMEYLRE